MALPCARSLSRFERLPRPLNPINFKYFIPGFFSSYSLPPGILNREKTVRTSHAHFKTLTILNNHYLYIMHRLSIKHSIRLHILHIYILKFLCMLSLRNPEAIKSNPMIDFSPKKISWAFVPLSRSNWFHSHFSNS